MCDEIVERLHFERIDPDGPKSCEVRIYADGSASVWQEGPLMIFEEAADAAKQAVKYVESRGYVRCSKG